MAETWMVGIASAVIMSLLVWVRMTLWNVSIDVAIIKQDLKQLRENEIPHLAELMKRLERRIDRVEGRDGL